MQPISGIGQRQVKGKVVVEIVKRDNIQKVGSIWVATLKRADNIEHFDPHFGTVVGGDRNGQIALFHKLCYKQALRGESKVIYEDAGKTYLMIPESDIYLYLNNDDIDMSGGWLLCESIGDEWEIMTLDGVSFLSKKTKSGLYIGKTDAHKEECLKARLCHISPGISEEFGISVGDILYLDRASDVPLEDDLNMQLEKQYFRVHINDVIGTVVENEI